MRIRLASNQWTAVFQFKEWLAAQGYDVEVGGADGYSFINDLPLLQGTSDERHMLDLYHQFVNEVLTR